jgi:hypothetical protein
MKHRVVDQQFSLSQLPSTASEGLLELQPAYSLFLECVNLSGRNVSVVCALLRMYVYCCRRRYCGELQIMRLHLGIVVVFSLGLQKYDLIGKFKKRRHERTCYG